MGSNGGYRPGSGAKKNLHRIAVSDLRRDLEAKLGMPYTQMLAESQLKLFQDFKNDKNVKEFVNFTKNMTERLLERDVQEVHLSSDDMSQEDIQHRIADLLKKKAPIEKSVIEPKPIVE
jgi:hypothetical protein